MKLVLVVSWFIDIIYVKCFSFCCYWLEHVLL